ncbi:MAG: flagellar protein FlgN [Desulfatitalea sp.]|nr:flagellar protein FlgN [Desulfatitalea sp.]
MNRLIEQLVAVLKQTETLYEQVLPIIEKEKEAALAPDAQQLMALNGEKQTLLAQLARLEQERTALAQRIGAGLHLPPEKLNLASLAAAVDAPYDRQLGQLHERLKAVVEKVRRSNEQCQTLIQYCLRLVQSRLGFFQHWLGRVDVYGASGNLNNGAGRGGRLLSGTV